MCHLFPLGICFLLSCTHHHDIQAIRGGLWTCANRVSMEVWEGVSFAQGVKQVKTLGCDLRLLLPALPQSPYATFPTSLWALVSPSVKWAQSYFPAPLEPEELKFIYILHNNTVVQNAVCNSFCAALCGREQSMGRGALCLHSRFPWGSTCRE